MFRHWTTAIEAMGYRSSAAAMQDFGRNTLRVVTEHLIARVESDAALTPDRRAAEALWQLAAATRAATSSLPMQERTIASLLAAAGEHLPETVSATSFAGDLAGPVGAAHEALGLGDDNGLGYQPNYRGVTSFICNTEKLQKLSIDLFQRISLFGCKCTPLVTAAGGVVGAGMDYLGRRMIGRTGGLLENTAIGAGAATAPWMFFTCGSHLMAQEFANAMDGWPGNVCRSTKYTRPLDSSTVVPSDQECPEVPPTGVVAGTCASSGTCDANGAQTAAAGTGPG